MDPDFSGAPQSLESVALDFYLKPLRLFVTFPELQTCLFDFWTAEPDRNSISLPEELLANNQGKPISFYL
jgi:hypothetical protein